MNCPHCGNPISPTDRFCPNCGADLGVMETMISRRAAPTQPPSYTEETLVSRMPPSPPYPGYEPPSPPPPPAAPPSGEARGRNTTLIVAVLLILLCCCCLIAVVAGYLLLGEDLLGEISMLSQAMV